MIFRRSAARLVRDIVMRVEDLLPPENIADARSLVEEGEWGPAFELVCTQLYEYDVSIDEELYDQVAKAGARMRLPANTWEILRELLP